MRISINIIFLLYINFQTLLSQNIYDIKNSGNINYNKCKKCYELLTNKPKEVQFGIKRNEDDELFFICTHKEWFDLLIKGKRDGFAVDIVEKSRYGCEYEKIEQAIIKGNLQKPLYSKELKANMLPSQYGEVIIKLGKVPKKYRDKEVEFNLIILKKGFICHFTNFYDLETYRWDLLDMGIYMDTLTYKSVYDTTLSEQEKYILQHKRLIFEIPFKKNEATFEPEDIKPLYDSLSLTNFDIKSINIRAYSSIEGSYERNIELQEQRAQSIVNALQSYQKPTISTNIVASENWVEFLNDISNTQFSDFINLSKNEIKEKLKNKKIADKVEPYLKTHRKAVIILELQKKDKYRDISVNSLLDLFNTSISDNNLEKAIEIQNSIFEKLQSHKQPMNILDKLEIPEKSEYSILLNKNCIFKYLMNESEVYDTYTELKELEEFLPNDGHIKYNICALKFKVWILGNQIVDPVAFKKEINNLKKYGIPNNLVKRMLINYNIIMSEYYMMAGDYINKDKSLKYIYSNYKYAELGDFDYLSIAQYFSSYAKYDWAIKLLKNEVRSIDVNEDLLFYYLNLTIIDEKLTKRSAYRSIMLNAININKERFCKLFDPFDEGGVTFQLLDNEYLRKTYCENCN